MKIIEESGYYISEPFHYEDLHAGNVIRKDVYTALWFRKGGFVMTFSKSNNPKFARQELLKEKRHANLLINGNEIELVFDKGSRFEVTKRFTILSSEKFISKSGTEYHYIPW
ncbi:hypothetical protein WJR50_00945 [Catalinimonas sp. 4WD22]|uniref:hypothetical protein n=1 Tax=Catalinimonas locisalis TaxID=3133978 RepID=UPI0031012F34